MYKSCRIALHGLCFYPDNLVLCCYSPNEHVNGGKAPVLFEKYEGEIIQKDNLFSKMEIYSSMFKEGKIPKECEGCFQIKNDNWNENKYIDFVTITHFSCCNANCIYCSNNLNSDERTNKKYNILPFLKYMRDESILKEGFELHIGGGEFTIYEECEEILNEFGANGFAKIFIPTNGIKYSQKLFDSLKSGNTDIIISLDCGSNKIFSKIKRVNAFEKTVENIYKYSKANPEKITLKYIIVPGFNDNLQEFNKFLEIGKKANIHNLRLDIDCRYTRKVQNKINPYYYDLAEKMRESAENNEFRFEYYSFFQQVINQGIKKKTLNDYIDFIKLKHFNFMKKQLYINPENYT